MLPPVIPPSPSSAAPRCEATLEQETWIGGCGFWIDFGVRARGSGKFHHLPSKVKGSSVNAFTITSSDSVQISFVSFGSTPKARIVARLLERAVPSSTRPFVSMSRVAIHSATRTGLLNGRRTTEVGRSLIRSVRAATKERNDSGADRAPLFCGWYLSARSVRNASE